MVFVGPNNSGKTSALQALALWDLGCRRWSEARDGSVAKERAGVVINRRDLHAIPAPNSKLLWKDLRTHRSGAEGGKRTTEQILISLSAEGEHLGKPWACGMEFYYANEESFYCRLRDGEGGRVPEGARGRPVVFLPPMSGLNAREHRKEPGEISVLIGEGRTAEVLRNLCWQVFAKEDKRDWRELVDRIRRMFVIELQDPQFIEGRSELVLTYRERSGLELDISSSGRGCQQVLLLLSYMLANGRSMLLLDEPDAHLEILRQRDVYNLITEVAEKQKSQIVAATHSEVVLQEAGERAVVMAFVGNPHRIDTRSRGAQIKKALESIQLADYYIAQDKGWMLYLEGSTDLAILSALARRLGHPAASVLSGRVPVQYLGSNVPQAARDHFYGLREAKPDLVGLALFDRLDRELHPDGALVERMWARREIENYVTTPESLLQFVIRDLGEMDLLARAEIPRRQGLIRQLLSEFEGALRLTSKPSPWGPDLKVTDEFLDPLFKEYHLRLGIPQLTFKRDYHGLAECMPVEAIDPEIGSTLDAILEVSRKAAPSNGRSPE